MSTNQQYGTQIKALPFPVYYWTMAGLAAAGVLDAVYLSISHYRVYTDMGYKSFCAVSRSINCDTVSQSPWSIFLGVSVPVWGILGYLFVCLLLRLAAGRDARPRRMWGLVFFIALAYSLYSLALAFISSYYIRSYCIMCIVSYAINLLLLYYSWLIIRRFVPGGILEALKDDLLFLAAHRRRTLSLFVPFLAVAALVWAVFPAYWTLTPPVLEAKEIRRGVSEEGHPWIGAENPELTITEFSDYLCFQCRKMHYYLRQIVAEHPDKIRLVHRHFPMEQGYNPLVKEAFHTGSGPMALLAIAAAEQGKFWEMNDFLYEQADHKKDFNTKLLGEKLGLDSGLLSRSLGDRRVQIKLRQDIREGLKLGITGTPGFVIDGKLYQGHIPAEILEEGGR